MIPGRGKLNVTVWGFLVAILFVVLLGYFSFESTKNFENNSVWVNHSREVLSEIDATFSALKDTQIAVRGYLLSGDEKFLEPYYPALTVINNSMESLRKLTADNPHHQQRLDILIPLIKSRIAFSENEITIRKNKGFDPAVQLLLSGEGIKKTEAIQKILGDMKDEENNLLNSRRTIALNSRNKTIRTFYVGAIFSFIVLVLIFYFLNQEINKREQAQVTRDSFFNLSSDLFCIANFRGYFLQLNPAWEKTLGFAREELMAEPFLNFIHPDDRPATSNTYDEQETGKNVTLFENRYRCKDGSYRWLLWNAVSLPKENIIYAVARDITERKQVEEALRKAHDELEIKVLERTADLAKVNRSLKTISECNQALVHATDENNLLQTICRIIVEIGGYRLAWIGFAETKDGERIHPVAQYGFEEGYLESLNITWGDADYKKWPSATAIHSGKVCIVNNILDHPDFTHWRKEANQLCYRSLISLPLTIEKKDLGAFTIYAQETDVFNQKELDLLNELRHDIEFGIQAIRTRDERRKAEEAVRESEERYRRAIAQADAVPYFRDHKTKKLTFYTDTIKNITGYSAKEITLEIWDKVIQEITMRGRNEGFSEQEAIQRIRHGIVEEWKADYRIKTKSGDTRWLADSSIQFLDKEGKSVGALGILQDITERHQAEEKIRKLNEELEQRVIERTAQLEATNKELESFSYSVSHDLRAPLRSVDGFSQALMEEYGDKFDASGKDYLSRVRSATQRMGELIDDLLNLSRVTRNQMQPERVNLSELAKAVVDRLQKTQPQRHVDIHITENLTATADKRLMDIVLENLLGNAWKFTGKTPKAKIEFGALPSQNGKQIFFVRDNGAGFDMTFGNKLFGAFQRLHAMTEFPGTGIGLATVQRIIHRHGGKVWAEAEVDKGATFYFTI